MSKKEKKCECHECACNKTNSVQNTNEGIVKQISGARHAKIITDCEVNGDKKSSSTFGEKLKAIMRYK